MFSSDKLIFGERATAIDCHFWKFIKWVLFVVFQVVSDFNSCVVLTAASNFFNLSAYKEL